MKLGRAQINRFAINRMMLLLCPALALLAGMVPLWTGTIDLVRYYAVYTLVIELGLFYIPAHRFISRRGGAAAFGLVRVSALECLFALLLGLGMFGVINAITGGMQLAFNALGARTVSVGAPLYAEGGWRLIATIVLVGLIPAYVEETLFRGALLFSWLPGGQARAVLHSAALFALVHMSPIGLPALFLFGVVLALAASWSGSIVPSAIIHGTNSLAAIVFAYAVSHLSPTHAQLLETILARDYLLVLGGIGAVCAAFSLLGLRFAARRGSAARQEAAVHREAAAPEQEPPADAKDEATRLLLPVAILQQQAFGERAMKLPVLVTYAFLITVNLFQLVFLFSEAMAA